MGFHETRLNPDISFGSTSGPGFMTDIIVLASGQEQAVARWDGAQRRYNLMHGVESYADISYLNKFYIARKGVANGWRLKDWIDYASTSDGRTLADDAAADPTANDVEIGVGDDTKVQFQLIKFYSDGNETRTRNIKKPVAGTVKIAFDGVEQTTGWSANATTGVVTFDVAPGIGVVITAGYEFDVPVRFGVEIDNLLNFTLNDFKTGQVEAIPAIEMIDPSELSDEFWHGGAITFDPMIANQTLSIGQGRTNVFGNLDADHSAILPDKTNLPPGGPYFYAINEDPTFSVDVLDDDATTNLATLAPGEHAVCAIGYEADNTTKKWEVLK